MAPQPSRKHELVNAHGLGSEESGEQSSQEVLDPVKAAQTLVNKYKKTRELCRNEIESEHKLQVEDTIVKIGTLFESRKMKVTKTRKDVFARLAALNKKRRSIESQILSSMRTIEIHSANISNELEAMFTGRLEEMDEPLFPESK